jgi:hypothetical protein
MSRAGQISAVTAFFVLVLVGLVIQSDTRYLTPTSYGAVPTGHGVLYDTLEELELPVSRSFARMDRLPQTATLWWIEPQRLIEADERTQPAEDPEEPSDSGEPSVREEPTGDDEPGEETASDPLKRSLDRLRGDGRTPAVRDLSGEPLAAWIEAGGTALVFLGADSDGFDALRIADVVVPARERLAASDPSAAAAPEDAAPPEEEAASGDLPEDPQPVELRGPLLPALRTVALKGPIVFGDPGADWRTVVSAAGRPFALERALGQGRLVVVADARFLWNWLFPRADAAPFALDLVRAYGVPRIDERVHGFSASRGVIATLAASPAALFFAGLALCGIVFAWLGGSLPRRRVGDVEPPAPTLEGYVDAMADYYAAAREYPRVLERYRELCARRLRRALALPPDATVERVVERATRSKRADPEALALLAGGGPARDLRGLVQAARKLDELVKEIAS